VTEGFEDRRLTSRTEISPLQASPQSAGMPLRAMFREKGIGRLAIAATRRDLEAACPVRGAAQRIGGRRLFTVIPRQS